MTSRILANPPAPGTPEWAKIVTASKVPALLGVSRFTSQYAAWHQLAGLIDVDMMDRIAPRGVILPRPPWLIGGCIRIPVGS
ncbi:hypothetical protein CU043_00415 [Corynebacterium striatum]|nr:hypothetical protein [Corynebacterium striatum]